MRKAGFCAFALILPWIFFWIFQWICMIVWYHSLCQASICSAWKMQFWPLYWLTWFLGSARYGSDWSCAPASLYLSRSVKCKCSDPPYYNLKGKNILCTMFPHSNMCLRSTDPQSVCQWTDKIDSQPARQFKWSYVLTSTGKPVQKRL